MRLSDQKLRSQSQTDSYSGFYQTRERWSHWEGETGQRLSKAFMVYKSNRLSLMSVLKGHGNTHCLYGQTRV